MKNLTEFLTNPIFNSLTQYPSIQTYHKIDKGVLQNELSFPTSDNFDVYITEKIDGSNIRLIIYNNDYLIGSRKEWIYAKGDRLIPNEQIRYIKKYVEEVLKSYSFKKNTLYCIYGEIHGSGIQSWKNYTLTKETYGFRIFDVWSMRKDKLENMTSLFHSIDEASKWRENNSQLWWTMDDITTFIIECGGLVEYAPFKLLTHIQNVPVDLEETYEFLKKFKKTLVNLDGNDKHDARAEGVVLRSRDRRYITKLRFEDYEKTLRKI